MDKKQKTYRDREERPRPKFIPLSTEQLNEYTGVYYSEELEATYVFRTDANSLVMRVGRYYSTPIECMKTDEFVWSFRSIVFNRDQAGNVTGFLLHEDPIRDLEFIKIK